MKNVKKRNKSKTIRGVSMALSILLVSSMSQLSGIIQPLKAYAATGSDVGAASVTDHVYPGGVQGASLWLKASDKVMVADGTTNVTSWTDANGIQFTTDSTKSGVTFNESLANFNPAVVFDGKGKMDGDQNTSMKVQEIFGIAKHNVTGTAVFSTVPTGTQQVQMFFGQDATQTLSSYTSTNNTPVNPNYQLNGPKARFSDNLRLLAASPQKRTAWENGVTNGINESFTDQLGARKLTLGENSSGANPLIGHVSELIVFDDNKTLTDDEMNQINSYLAFKYGVTLKTGTAANNSATDYVASDGTTKMWTAADNAGYGNRITGIGRDELSGLYQRQSKSADQNANVTLALGNSVEPSNSANQNQITADKSFFTFSDDNGSDAYNQDVTIAGAPADLQRMARNMKVEKTSNWEDTEITLQLAGVDEKYNYYLLVDNAITKLEAGQVSLNSSELVDGGTFTFARALKPATPLATPGNVHLTGSELSWDTVANADKYEVTITPENGTPVTVEVTTGTNLDLSTLKPPLTAGSYELTVIAKSNDSAYTDSVPSDKATYTVPATTTPLATPGNVHLTGSELSWDTVANANKYEVTITPENGTPVTVEVTTGTNLDLSTLKPPLTAGSYDLTVIAKSNDSAYTDSVPSDKATYTVPATTTPLATPGNVHLTGSELSWDTVANADKYEVTITPENGEPVTVEVTTGTNLDLSTLKPPLTAGSYELTVIAKSNDSAYTDSAPSDKETYTSELAVDKSNLQIEVDLAKDLNESNYTTDSWANYQVELAKAKEVLANDAATQKQVDEALKALQAAKAALVESDAESVLTGLLLNSWNGTPVGLSPSFNGSTTKYTASVINSVYAVTILPTVLDPDAKIEVSVNNDAWQEVPNGTASGNLSLNVGTNTIVVKVTDAKGSVTEYTLTVTRESGGSGNNGGDNGGNNGGNNGGSTTTPTTPTTPVMPTKPVEPGIETSVNDKDGTFATGKTSTSGDLTTTSVQVDLGKLNEILAQGGQKLAIRSPKVGDVKIDGLTAGTVKQLADKGASLEISNPLAIYPVPGGKMDLDSVSKQLGNSALNDIAVEINISRSADTLIQSAKSKASAEGYELLAAPVDLDLTFTKDGKTIRSGRLNGYAQKYIALPEGIDPNRITTGVVINPDGSVFHVPTVVTKIDNRYYALINDLRSSGTYSVIWNPQDFDDVRYHWGKEDVNNIAARLDLEGTGNNTFSPNRNVTRSEFADIVVLGLGLMRQDVPQNIFPDVADSAWYRASVAIANEFGIVRGYNDGSFYGNQEITREQGFSMIARAYRLIDSGAALSSEQEATALAGYKDASDVSAWAKADVAQLIAAGIIQGNGPEVLSPKAPMTRAEVTALIARMLKITDIIDK